MNLLIIKRWAWVILLLPVVLIAYQWQTAQIASIGFQVNVPVWRKWTFLETHYLYFYLHAFTFIPVFLLSFDRKVAFFKQWKYGWKPLLIANAVYWLWDIGKTSLGVWGFNSKYITGYFVFNLPVEEILFFITVPYACVFIYYCIRAYFPKNILLPAEKFLTPILISVLLGLGFYQWELTYTSTTCLIAGFYLLYNSFTAEAWIRARLYVAFMVCMLPFLLVDGVLTGGYQSEPIILYHPEEFLNFRIGSIPIEDAIYFLPYMLFIVSEMEKNSQSEKD